MRRAVIWLLVCAVAISGAFLFVVPAQAAPNYDFTSSNGSWYTGTVTTGTPGTWTNGTGWVHGDVQNPANNYYRGVYIKHDFSAFTITKFDMVYDLPSKNTNSSTSNTFIQVWTSTGVNLITVPYSQHTTGTNLTRSWSGSIANVTYVGVIIWSSYYTYNNYAGSVTIKEIRINDVPTPTPTITNTPTVTPTPTNTPVPLPSGWYKPFRAEDQPIVRSGEYTVQPFMVAHTRSTITNGVIMSYAVGAVNVHAATEGEVTAIDRVDACRSQGVSNISDGSTYIRADASEGRPPSSCANVNPNLPAETWTPLTTITPTDYLRADQVYAITILLPDNRQLIYLVSSPMVEVGQTVQGGCVIGKGINGVYRETGNLLDGPYLEESWAWTAVAGVAVGGTELFALSSWLTNEPTGNLCEIVSNSPCPLVGDPYFRESGFWEWMPPANPAARQQQFASSGGVEVIGKYQQRLNLDPSKSYAITVVYRPMRAYVREFFVKLGDEAAHQIYQVGTVAGQTVTTVIDAQTYTENSSDGVGNYFWLEVYANASQDVADVIVDFVCVAESNAGLPPPGGCLLFDPELDQGTNYWDVTGTIPPSFVSGTAWIKGDGTITQQSVKLFPKESSAQNYTLTVRARRAGVAVDGEYVTVQYRWGEAGAFTNVGTTENQTWRDLTATIEVSGTATHPLTIQADFSNSATSDSVHIDRICITTSDGTAPPGYGAPPVIEAICKVCAYIPTGDVATDLSELVAWLGCFFSQLWECQAKIVLMGIWNTLVSVLTMLGYMRMWAHESITNFVAWANANLQMWGAYFNGHFSNLLQGIFGIPGGGGGGGSIWDFLTALTNLIGTLLQSIVSLIQPFLNLIANAIGMLITLFVNFVAQGLALILGVIQSILNGINAAPATALPEWFPDCSDAANPLIGVCGGLSLLEGNLASGPALYFVPIAFGLAIIKQLLWAVEKFLRTFGGGGAEAEA